LTVSGRRASLHQMRAFEPYAYVLLRIFAGFMFFWHGVQKLFGWPPSEHVVDAFTKYVGGGIEFIAGLLTTFGLFTRPAAFLASGMMAVAYWMVHGLKSGQPLPIQNRGELAVIYCFVFLFICTRGSGKLSLDRARKNAKKT
jgi:putative oxidoreductase